MMNPVKIVKFNYPADKKTDWCLITSSVQFGFVYPMRGSEENIIAAEKAAQTRNSKKLLKYLKHGSNDVYAAVLKNDYLTPEIIVSYLKYLKKQPWDAYNCQTLHYLLVHYRQNKTVWEETVSLVIENLPDPEKTSGVTLTANFLYFVLRLAELDLFTLERVINWVEQTLQYGISLQYEGRLGANSKPYRASMIERDLAPVVVGLMFQQTLPDTQKIRVWNFLTKDMFELAMVKPLTGMLVGKTDGLGLFVWDNCPPIVRTKIYFLLRETSPTIANLVKQGETEWSGVLQQAYPNIINIETNLNTPTEWLEELIVSITGNEKLKLKVENQ